MSPSHHQRPKMASQADRYDLYLKSVQEPEHEVGFFVRVFKKAFNRKPLVLREDFCGTAAICYAWVHKQPGRRAIGVDLDPEPLNWGQQHLAPACTPAELKRVKLLQEDVRHISREKADILAAQNFSFWIFKQRKDLLTYFRAAHANLASKGLMVLDMMGGADLQHDEKEETTRKKGFTYVWEQESFDPITHDCRFHIHFRFPDGSQIQRAFTYDWRMWTIPEVREILLEAGFRKVDVYWEGSDEKGDGNGIFRIQKKAAPDPAWITYMVAVK